MSSILGKAIAMNTDFFGVDKFIIIGLSIIHQINLEIDHGGIIPHGDNPDIDC